jgi:predicted aconitase with swiveling domain
MELTFVATPVIWGSARGKVLRLDGPISFWGGVDPATGRLTEASERYAGESVAGRIMMIPETRGSSSSSAVLLELIHGRHAPAAIVLGAVDAILGLGILVAREMKWPAPPLFVLPRERQAVFCDGDRVEIGDDGQIFIDRNFRRDQS